MLPLIALLLVASQDASAAPKLQLSPYFGDHMVLQCGRENSVWGEAPPGSSVSMVLEREGSSDVPVARVQADAEGHWRIALASQPAGGPATLRVATEGSAPLACEDVWFGDVWICSGQSNMEFQLKDALDADQVIAAANQPRIRLLHVPRRTADAPRSDPQGSWTECTPETVPTFSAVGYLFGLALAEHLDRPIGLIESSWGGTPAEAWTERSFLEGDADFASILERQPRNESWAGSALFDGMIAPIAPIALTGVIWYQGESNADRAEQYRTLFPAMIRSWRKAFRREDLPFLFVQLANFKARKDQPGESDWAELREAQTMTLSLPATGMAVILDVGDAKDIHPKDKRTVGERLALEAYRVAYGQDVVSRGPTYRSMQVEGDRVTVELDHAEGLKTTDGAAPMGFALAGEDRVFHWAEAQLDGTKVVLRCAEVPAPVAVRFAWADNPADNLINGAGLPAAPFRTDDWPGVTAGRR